MIELLRKRRSIRTFTAEKVSDEAVRLLIEAALRSPTSRGINPWRFIVVDDPDRIAQLARAKEHGSAFLKNAPLAVVVCADSEASDVWVEDCAIAAIVIQLTALSLGLGSCWAQIRNRPQTGTVTAEAYIQDLLGLPDRIRVECIIGIGHPAEKKHPVPIDALQPDKVKFNRWQ